LKVELIKVHFWNLFAMGIFVSPAGGRGEHGAQMHGRKITRVNVFYVDYPAILE
jgi:hypothetical protein